MKRASRGQQKGSYVRVAVLLDDFIQPGWRGLLSVWSAGWEHLCFSGSSRAPFRVLLNLRRLMLGNIVASTSAQNQSVIYNWPVFLSEQILKPPLDLAKP